MKPKTTIAIMWFVILSVSFPVSGMDNAGELVVVIENDKQSISAYEGENRIWTLNVIEELGVPDVGSAEVKALRMDGEFVYILYGKHSWAKAGIKTGNLIYIGAD